MMTTLLSRAIIIALLTITNFCYAQSNIYAKAIKVQANEMGVALVSGDYSRYMQYLYPGMITKMGGTQQISRALEKMKTGFKISNTVLNEISFDNPSQIYQVGKELQCTINQKTEVESIRGKIITQSTLIAISEDSGKNWKFMDTGGKGFAILKSAFPNLSDKLVIAKMPNPIVAN